MSAGDLTIIGSTYGFNDDVLLDMVKEYGKNANRTKKALSKQKRTGNYSDVTVARLAYSFAMEQYNSLMGEVKRRGLVTAV